MRHEFSISFVVSEKLNNFPLVVFFLFYFLVGLSWFLCIVLFFFFCIYFALFYFYFCVLFLCVFCCCFAIFDDFVVVKYKGKLIVWFHSPVGDVNLRDQLERCEEGLASHIATSHLHFPSEEKVSAQLSAKFDRMQQITHKKCIEWMR